MAENKIERLITGMLTPFFGEKSAAGVLQLSCQTLHIDHANIDKANLAALSKEIEKRLIIFLGTQKAGIIAKNIESLTV